MSKLQHTLSGIGGLLLAVMLFIGVNLLADRYLERARYDLTDQGLYTLSEGTRQVLSNLADPVTVRLFLSRDALTPLPALSLYANRVEELLREFERESAGNLELRIIDPRPFSEDEDRAVAYGLQGVPLGDGESVLYFGVVVSGPTTAEEVVPFLSPERERFLEYDLSKMVYQVSVPGRPVVGMLSALPLAGGPGPLPGVGGGRWAILDQLEQFFEVRILDQQTAKIPDDLAALMVVYPENLPERTLYAVDQYVLSGGPALVFVDPYAESAGGGLPGAVGDGSAVVGELLGSWGLSMDDQAVVADINLAQRVRAVVGGRNSVVDYPVWVTVEGALLNDNDVVTASLGQVALGTAGKLAPVEAAAIRTTALIETTADAATVDPSRLGPGSNPAELIQGYVPAGEPAWLAVRVSGRARSAWPGGPPATADPSSPETVSEEEGVAHRDRSEKDINLVVVADTDLLQDDFWVRPQNLLGARLLVPVADNDALVLNALENLAGNAALIGLRTRGDFSRPFTLIEDVRAEAELRFRQKELELVAELDATEQRLSELQRQDSGDAVILDRQQLEELDRFRQRKLEIRGQLREVRRDLRADIEAIESWVRMVNIGLMPLLVGLGGLGLAIWRRRRRLST